MNKKKIYTSWFMAPALIIFTIFFIIPMLTSLFFSLTVWNFKDFTFVGLDNFKMFFSERSLNIGIKNTLIYAFLTCSLKVVIAFFIAVFLTSKIKSKNILRSIVFFPNLVSTVAVGIVFSAMMHPSKGLINTALQAIGLNGVDWLGNTSLALFSVIGVDVWKGVGVATVIYIAGMQSIDKTYYEAASIDGATKVQQFFKITVPMMKPTISMCILLDIIGSVKVFDLVFAMTGGGPNGLTNLPTTLMYNEAFKYSHYGLGSAIGIIILIICLGGTLISNKLMSSKEN